MGKNKIKFDFDSGNILIYMLSKAKILIGISIVAFIVSAIASIMITPKFKSTVIIFPTSTATVSKSVLNTQYYNAKGDLLNFGEEEECDQLMQVLLSNEMKDLINSKYNLMGHYDIDSTKTKYSMTEYYSAFEDNFRFRRSEYLSIIINVFDTDPKLASAMANEIPVFADTIVNRMKNVRAKMAYAIVQNECQKLESIINVQEDSAQKLRLLGAANYEDQNIVLGRLYYQSLLKGKPDIARLIKNRLDVVAKYAKNLAVLENTVGLQREQLTSLKFKLTEASAELNQRLPSNFVVEKAMVSEKKAYPRRSLIVLTSTIAAFFFSLVLLVFVDSIKKHI